MREDRTNQRGATLVEYSLLVAFVAVLALSAIDRLGAGLDSNYIRVNESVRTGQMEDPPPGSGGGGGGGGSGTTTTTKPSGGTTTTTAPSGTATAGLGSPQTWSTTWGLAWTGTAQVTLQNAQGQPLAGAVVTIRLEPVGGEAQTITVTTGADGKATVDIGTWSRWTRPSIEQVDLTITGVDAGPGVTWDGNASSVTLRSP